MVAVLAQILLCGCDPAPPAPDKVEPQAPPVTLELEWTPPAQPSDVPAATAPRVVMLTAPWCQWCMVMHAEVLDRSPAKQALRGRFQLAEVNVDRFPEWMNLPDVQGLPTLVFFDTRGQHVLSKSGFRDEDAFIDLLRSVDQGLRAGEITPYAPRPISRLADQPITSVEAQAAITKFERELFFKVNSNDGGFGSPSRHPQPALLVELVEWAAEFDAPERTSTWVRKTVASASRGESPLLSGTPLPGIGFEAMELQRLSREQHRIGPRWREAIEALPNQDPYLGLRDPLDGGYFRYAAGPGWYNPHFERLARENLAWVVLLRLLGKDDEPTGRFIETTFRRPDRWWNAAQASDPFYYRLPVAARGEVDTPPVAACASLDVQAWGTRADRSMCDQFVDALPSDRWPLALMDDETPSSATTDGVGEALVAAGRCGASEAVAPLADVVADVWRRGLPADARLHRLAAGLCAVEHASCGAALATIVDIRVDTRYAPPLVALARAGIN